MTLNVNFNFNITLRNDPNQQAQIVEKLDTLAQALEVVIHKEDQIMSLTDAQKQQIADALAALGVKVIAGVKTAVNLEMQQVKDQIAVLTAKIVEGGTVSEADMNSILGMVSGTPDAIVAAASTAIDQISVQDGADNPPQGGPGNPGSGGPGSGGEPQP